jgi:hypothetical protein
VVERWIEVPVVQALELELEPEPELLAAIQSLDKAEDLAVVARSKVAILVPAAPSVPNHCSMANILYHRDRQMLATPCRACYQRYQQQSHQPWHRSPNFQDLRDQVQTAGATASLDPNHQSELHLRAISRLKLEVETGSLAKISIALRAKPVYLHFAFGKATTTCEDSRIATI